jgi:putative transcriptional regulator
VSDFSGLPHQPETQDFLTGKLLVAMPTMEDPRFEKSVIYIWSQSAEEGARGLIINKPAPHITFSQLLRQLNIDSMEPHRAVPVQVGGPVDSGRGFVLHTVDHYASDSTLKITPEIALTATLDVLRAIAGGRGPRRAILALGYASWEPGQLETEMLANGWLHCEADADLIFDADLDTKWYRAIATLGFQPQFLSAEAGHA